MIEGRIGESGTPVVSLQVMGTGGRTATIEGILDTGFDGFYLPANSHCGNPGS